MPGISVVTGVATADLLTGMGVCLLLRLVCEATEAQDALLYRRVERLFVGTLGEGKESVTQGERTRCFSQRNYSCYIQ